MTTTQNAPQPSFRPMGFTSSWREEALARICELRILTGALLGDADLDDDARALLNGAREELDHADQAVRRRTGIITALTGGAVQRVHGHLDAAEVLVLRGAPLAYVWGQTAALVVYVRRHLPPSDPRCQSAERLLAAEQGSAAAEITGQGSGPRGRSASRSAVPRSAAAGRRLSQIDRERLVSAVQGAMAEARNEQMRLRSFRNLLLNSAIGLLALAIGVCVFGALAPDKLPVCFEPLSANEASLAPAPASATPSASGTASASTTASPAPTATPATPATPAGNAQTPPVTRRLVCPTGESPLPAQADVDTVVDRTASPVDVPLVELLGLIAAAVAAATALRKVRGTSTPYSLPAALAFLKLPLGALTALFGLILMRADFVPGLSALDDSAQIIGWAIVFGYAQQAFTQVVDRKAQNLLDDVGAADQREKPTAPGPDPNQAGS